MPDVTRKTISSTEAPALIDASPYITRFMLYRQFKHGEDIRSPEHNRMDWGKRMEHLLLEAAAEDLHYEVIPNRGPDGKQLYESRNLLGCTRDSKIICPDRGPGALEVKVCFDYRVWMNEWNGGKQPPRHIEIQNQIQMYVGESGVPYKWGVIGVWCAGEMTYFERKPIPALWTLLEEKAREFFADVEAGNEPSPFGAAIEIPTLTEAFPLIKGKVLDLSALTSEAVATGDGGLVMSAEDKRRIAAAESARMLKWHAKERLGHDRAEKALKAELMALALDAEEVLLPGGVTIGVKDVRRRAYEVKPSHYKTLDVYAPEAK